MIWTIIWFSVCIFYLVFSIIQIKSPDFKNTDLIIIVIGFMGLLASLLKHLYQNNLTCYLHWVRFKNWFRNYPVNWDLNIRFDGSFDEDVISKIEKFIQTNQRVYDKTKVFHRTKNSLNFSVFGTLNFYLDFQPKHINNFNYDTIDISLNAFEIGSNSSKRKLESEIIPFLSKLQNILKPDNTSYVLNITFIQNNPFFTIFISHLNPSQIKSFNINLHIDAYSRNSFKDVVTITKENIIINANDLHSLKELANDFIYLSTNVKQYLRVANYA